MLSKHISLSRKLALLFHISIIFNSQFLIFFFFEGFLTLLNYPSFQNLLFPRKEKALIFFWNLKIYPSKFSNSCIYACVQSRHTLCDAMDCSPPDSSVHGVLPGKNTRVGCHFLLQGIFPTQGVEPRSFEFPLLASRFFTTAQPVKPKNSCMMMIK